MFYLGGSYGRRKVCYIRKGDNLGEKLKFVKRNAFASGFMAWAGVPSRGKTEIRIIDKGRKVNSVNYINKVLNPFLKMFQDFFEGAKAMTFHQDSAFKNTCIRCLITL
jgi:hypothetical protein